MLHKGLTSKWYIVILMLIGTGCAMLENSSNQEYQYQSSNHVYISVDSTITPDSAISAMIAPYAEDLEAIMQRVLVTSEGTFVKKQPEGPLGNLIADIVRRRASLELKTWVDMSVINNGGLRRPITKGPVTTRDIYELMPFENTLVILTMTGNQVQHLADEIIETGGEPISGLRMKKDSKQAKDILIGTRTLSADSTYLVATNNYLVEGGGNMPALWDAVEAYDTGISIREIIIDYLETKRTIEPTMDGRIR